MIKLSKSKELKIESFIINKDQNLNPNHLPDKVLLVTHSNSLGTELGILPLHSKAGSTARLTSGIINN